MMDMKKIGPVVRTLRKDMSMTLEQLANDAGYDTGNLSKFERGIQGIEDETLDRIAAALKTKTSDLLRKAADLEEQSTQLIKELEHGADSNFSTAVNPHNALMASEPSGSYASPPHAVRELNKVPVYEERHLLALADSPSAASQIPSDKYIPSLPDARPNDFAWQVSDDSMTAPAGELVSYPSGSFAYMDAETPFKSGDAVLVALGTSHAFTRVVNINGNWMLSPLNTRYPTREMPLNAKVVAVAIGCMSITRQR